MWCVSKLLPRYRVVLAASNILDCPFLQTARCCHQVSWENMGNCQILRSFPANIPIFVWGLHRDVFCEWCQFLLIVNWEGFPITHTLKFWWVTTKTHHGCKHPVRPMEHLHILNQPHAPKRLQFMIPTWMRTKQPPQASNWKNFTHWVVPNNM